MPETEFTEGDNKMNASEEEYKAATIASYQKCLHSFKDAMDAYEAHYNIVAENGLSPDSRIQKMQLFHEGMHVMYEELEDQGRDFGYAEEETKADKAAAEQLLKSVSGLF